MHTGGSATTALHGSHTKRCACCFRIDEGKGLRKIFSYGGEVSTAMCGTCRSFKSRLLNSNKVGTVRLPLQISTSFCVDLHRVLNLMGVCLVNPHTSGDSTLSMLAAELVRTCDSKAGWQTFEIADQQLTRHMFNVSETHFCVDFFDVA